MVVVSFTPSGARSCLQFRVPQNRLYKWIARWDKHQFQPMFEALAIFWTGALQHFSSTSGFTWHGPWFSNTYQFGVILAAEKHINQYFYHETPPFCLVNILVINPLHSCCHSQRAKAVSEAHLMCLWTAVELWKSCHRCCEKHQLPPDDYRKKHGDDQLGMNQTFDPNPSYYRYVFSAVYMIILKLHLFKSEYTFNIFQNSWNA